MWMNCVGQFAYVALYEGLANAGHGRVQIVSRAAPAHLSNGQILHTRVWSASLMPDSLLVIYGLAGLTYMGKQIGRLFHGWKRIL
jgi:hypothetical protein